MKLYMFLSLCGVLSFTTIHILTIARLDSNRLSDMDYASNYKLDYLQEQKVNHEVKITQHVSNPLQRISERIVSFDSLNSEHINNHRQSNKRVPLNIEGRPYIQPPREINTILTHDNIGNENTKLDRLRMGHGDSPHVADSGQTAITEFSIPLQANLPGAGRKTRIPQTPINKSGNRNDKNPYDNSRSNQKVIANKLLPAVMQHDATRQGNVVPTTNSRVKNTANKDNVAKVNRPNASQGTVKLDKNKTKMTTMTNDTTKNNKEDDDDDIVIEDDTDDNDHDDDTDEETNKYENLEFKPGDFDPLPVYKIETKFKNIKSKLLETDHKQESVTTKQYHKQTIPDRNIKHSPVDPLIKPTIENGLSKASVSLYSDKGVPIVVDKIYWSKEVEASRPSGNFESNTEKLITSIRRSSVATMQPPTWNKCGRLQNQYIVLQNGIQLCARYREPHTKLIAGEVLSFYLGRLLGLDNIPVVVLSSVSSASPSKWPPSGVKKAQWKSGKTVALIQWINQINQDGSRVRMPNILLKAYENRRTLDGYSQDLAKIPPNELTMVLQWSEMILFDYIIGHYDRVASMQEGADKEHSPQIMHETMRNLRKSYSNGKLWLIDNESGLFDGYELMYRPDSNKFIQFHREILQTICIFRKSIVDNIMALAGSKSAERTLLDYASSHEPLLDSVLRSTKEFNLYMKYFTVRLKSVVQWINYCKNR